MEPLHNRTILVTGGSSGIGRALTRRYLQAGAAVVTVGRRADALAATVEGAPPGRATTVAGDLTTEEGRQAVAEAAASRLGHLDVAVHAAGLLGKPGVPLAEYPAHDWYTVFEANVSAVHFLHQRLVELHAAAERPTVIGVSSTVGRRGRAGWGMYAVSKFALEGWLETLADEWGERGRVYSVNPGGTATPMRAAAVPGEDPASLPTPDDIAPIFLRLAHADTPEQTGSKLSARDWIGTDPWQGLHES